MDFDTKKHNIFVCSDSHYSHKNLIKNLSTWTSGAHRDYSSIEEHNDILVQNINKTVGKNDILFMLGDVSFGGVDNVRIFMDRIICDEIHLIFGNHDKNIIDNKNNLKSCFTTTSFYREIFIDKEEVVLFHYPIKEWNNAHKGSYQLYGHQHNLPENRFSNKGRSMDIGFDGHPEFRPYNINEIFGLLKDKEIITHH